MCKNVDIFLLKLSIKFMNFKIDDKLSNEFWFRGTLRR